METIAERRPGNSASHVGSISIFTRCISACTAGSASRSGVTLSSRTLPCTIALATV